MDFNRWWANDPDELYWLEITDRANLGVDLNAPQRGGDGKEVWHYSLINEVRDGEIVFHYHRLEGRDPAISAWSVARGEVWEDQVLWAPHAGERTEPVVLPGWRLALEGFHVLSSPVTLLDIREEEDLLRVVSAELDARYGGTLYLPFELGTRQTRPKQAYLAKFPAALVPVFGPLQEATDLANRATSIETPVSDDIGELYRRPDPAATVATADPFARDPSLVERGLAGHALTQNRLAEWVGSHGAEPRSPAPTEPNYDLAWELAGTIFVAEVKSTTLDNAERQLRLGLGQVLRYQWLLRRRWSDLRAVLAAEAPPSDPVGWTAFAESHGVTLVWPGVFERLAGEGHQ